jgi:hypothetical protein
MDVKISSEAGHPEPYQMTFEKMISQSRARAIGGVEQYPAGVSDPSVGLWSFPFF